MTRPNGTAKEPVHTRPWMKLWVTDWLLSPAVAQMTVRQEGMYLRLLLHAWVANPPCTLPNADRMLAALAKVSPAVWKKEGPLVKAQFTALSPAWLRNTKQWEVYEQMEAVRTARQAAGARGADERWHSRA